MFRLSCQIKSFRYPESVRIAILQLACLFVQYCAPHIHDAVSKRQQGQKMRKLMGFAWPCLLPKACVDPSTKYHGHLLLVHIIAKFPINKKIVLQVSFLNMDMQFQFLLAVLTFCRIGSFMTSWNCDVEALLPELF